MDSEPSNGIKALNYCVTYYSFKNIYLYYFIFEHVNNTV